MGLGVGSGIVWAGNAGCTTNTLGARAMPATGTMWSRPISIGSSGGEEHQRVAALRLGQVQFPARGSKMIVTWTLTPVDGRHARAHGAVELSHPRLIHQAQATAHSGVSLASNRCSEGSTDPAALIKAKRPRRGLE